MWIWFLIGLWAGGCLGFALAALLGAAALADERAALMRCLERGDLG